MEDPQNRIDAKKIYKEVLGKDPEGDLRGLREFTVDHLFGKIWVRGILSTRDRRLITIALLAAQGFTKQLEDHISGAIKAEPGLSEDELFEIMVHVGHYASWAAGTSGNKIIQNCFPDKEDLGGKSS